MLTWTDGVAAPPLAGVPGAAGSPYRGLGAFEERDEAFFFGRDDAADAVLELMSGLSAGPSLLVVSGASGAGKSSLLRAGVLPKLRARGLTAVPSAASWPCLVLTPGHSPLDELAVRSALLTGGDPAAIRRGLAASPEEFALTARQAALAAAASPPQAGQRLLLVVDQFEQVFTRCEDEGEQRAFIRALSAAAGIGSGPDGDPPAMVVLGVRADFEARCTDYPELADAIQDRYLVMPMTGRQLRLAITGPARVAGSQVEDELTRVLVAEAQSRAGASVLPLLSHALDQAWRRRGGPALTLADYERTGGIEAAVARSAERAYDGLTSGQQAVARRVFTRLTATSAEGLDTADRSTLAELKDARTPAEIADIEVVLDAFEKERLLTLAADSVEISHEALLTAWPLLRDTWLAENHADQIIRTRLRSDSAEWATRSRDASYLYRGSLLAAAGGTASRIAADATRNLPLSRDERDFLDASTRAQNRSARLRQGVMTALAILTVIAVATAVVAVEYAHDAAQQHALALSRQLAAESLAAITAHPAVARQLAVAAWDVSPTDQARTAMAAMLASQQQSRMLLDAHGIEDPEFSPDGRKLLTVDGGGSVRLWNPSTGEVLRQLRPPVHDHSFVVEAAFSPDARQVITVTYGGTVRFRNTATGRQAGPVLRVNSDNVALSPDGRLLAAVTRSGNVRLWDLADRHPLRNRIRAGVTGDLGLVAFSPDDRLLATASGNLNQGVRLWNLATGHQIGPGLAIGSDDNVSAIAFSPDGRLLATATVSSHGNGSAQLWRVPAGSLLASWTTTGRLEPLPDVDKLAFSPDGKLVAAAISDGTVRLWSTATRKVTGTITPPGGFSGGSGEVAFSPDSGTLATAEGSIVQLWNPVTRRLAPGALPAGTGSKVNVDAVGYSPDGKLLAVEASTPVSGGTIRIWNSSTGRLSGTARLPGDDPEPAFAALAFSPDGTLLAAADDNSVQLSDLAARKPARPRTWTSHGPDLAAISFTRNSRQLAAADLSANIRLLDPATGQPDSPPTRARTSGSLDAAAFTPGGSLLATVTCHGPVQLWNPVTGTTAIHAITPPGGCPDEAALSPDGRLLATIDRNDHVHLLNLTTGRSTEIPVRAEGFTDTDLIAFSPDSTILAIADANGTVRLCDTTTGRPVGIPIPAGKHDKAEALAFSPGSPLLAVSAADPRGGTVQQWNSTPFINPYRALCTETGPPTPREWRRYAPGEPFRKACQ